MQNEMVNALTSIFLISPLISSSWCSQFSYSVLNLDTRTSDDFSVFLLKRDANLYLYVYSTEFNVYTNLASCNLISRTAASCVYKFNCSDRVFTFASTSFKPLCSIFILFSDSIRFCCNILCSSSSGLTL